MAEDTREITSNRVVFPDNRTLDEVMSDFLKRIEKMEAKIKTMEGEENDG